MFNRTEISIVAFQRYLDGVPCPACKLFEILNPEGVILSCLAGVSTIWRKQNRQYQSGSNLRERIWPPSGYSGKQSRTEVPRRVDGVATVEGEAGANAQHDGAESDGEEAVTRCHVASVCDGQHTAQKDERAEYLKRRIPAMGTWPFNSHIRSKLFSHISVAILI